MMKVKHLMRGCTAPCQTAIPAAENFKWQRSAKQLTTKAAEVAGKEEPHLLLVGRKFMQTLWKSARRTLTKHKIILPQDSAIPPLGICTTD
ncbi:hypothetical protein LEMLEM_LOCUS16601, partial [Lemmus lemmus]